MLRLRNLGIPQDRIDEVRNAGTNPRTLDWPSPADGDVIEKKVINGQRVKAGDELYRIADHSQVWVIADVAESDIAAIKVGMPVTVTVRAARAEPVEGEGDVHLSGAEPGDAHRACPHRTAESRWPHENGDVRRRGVPDGRRRSAVISRSGQRGHRQRSAPGRAWSPRAKAASSRARSSSAAAAKAMSR